MKAQQQLLILLGVTTLATALQFASKPSMTVIDATSAVSEPSLATCSDGDVMVGDESGNQLSAIAANEKFVPYVCYNGEFYRICGHFFWDNDDGATTVCKALGFNSGKRPDGGDRSLGLSADAMPVGKCKADESLDKCTDSPGYNGWGDFGNGNGWCKAGQNAGFKMYCDSGSGSTSSSSSASAGCQDPVGDSATCSAWGDPHVTATFNQGSNHFDFQGVGLYKLASTKDGCFEVQTFQCPRYSVAVYVGFAIKTGTGSVVQIVAGTVYIDGKEVSSDAYPSNLSMSGTPNDGFCLSSQGCGNETMALFEVHRHQVAGYPFGGEMTMTIKMSNPAIGPGFCVDGKPGAMDCTGSLFSDAQLTQLKSSCGVPECVQPDDYVPAEGPEDVCTAAGIDMSQAEAACAGTTDEFKNNCLIDYCGSGGDDSAVDGVPDTPSPPMTGAPTPPPTPSPPTPSPPTPNVPECTDCGPRPMECWETCGQKKGYCSACDSASGTRGACCYNAGDTSAPAPPADDMDPHECDTVDPAQFLYTGYHVCVLLP